MSATTYSPHGARRILIWADFFLPGYKAGGPIKSIDLLTQTVDKIDFLIVTRDRDLGDDRPYEGSASGRQGWVPMGRRSVWYVDVSRVRHYLSTLAEVRRQQVDAYYFNSIWSPLFTLLPLFLVALRVLPYRPVIIAPRGELAKAPLLIRRRPKKIIGVALRVVLRGLPLSWHATSKEEAADIEAWTSTGVISTAANLGAPQASASEADAIWNHSSDTVRCVYFSRIVPKKNLLTAIEAVGRTRCKATLDIIGPSDDDDYKAACVRLVRQEALDGRVRFLGARAPDELKALLPAYDAFVFPTFNENFGHAVVEALGFGVPVITSTETPWTEKLFHLGLNPCEPEDAVGFANEIDRLAALPPAEAARLRDNIRETMQNEIRISNGIVEEKMIELFSRAIGMRNGRRDV